jgi:hypothetical protein
MIKNSTSLCLFFCTALVLLAIRTVSAEFTPTPSSVKPTALHYPTSSEIKPEALHETRRTLLSDLIEDKVPRQKIPKAIEQLCPYQISRSTSLDPSVSSALATLKSGFGVEARFTYNGDKKETHIKEYSILVDFEPQQVLLRHSSPRFKSEGTGFYVPFPRDFVRAVRLEGTLNADILGFIAPTRECGVQAVVLCPRRYAHREKLVQSPFTLTDLRAIPHAKADGLHAPAENITQKIVASLRASTNINLPTQWSVTSEGNTTLSSTVTADGSTTDSKYTPIDKLPVHMVLEARVDVGTKDAPLRISSKKTSVEISTIDISERFEMRVGRSNLYVEGGSCYLIAAWEKESI